MTQAAAALATFKVIFQRAVARADLDHGVNGGFGEGRAAQVGVQNHAGGVDDAAQAKAEFLRELRGGVFEQGGAGRQRCVAGADGRACLLQGCAQGLQRGRAAVLRAERLAGGVCQQGIDRRQIAQGLSGAQW